MPAAAVLVVVVAIVSVVGNLNCVRNDRTLSQCSDGKETKADTNKGETPRQDEFRSAVIAWKARRRDRNERSGRNAASTPMLSRHHRQMAAHGNGTLYDRHIKDLNHLTVEYDPDIE